MMEIRIEEESPQELAEYGRVPISFEVRRIYDVEPIASGLGGIAPTLLRVNYTYGAAV